MIQLLGSRLDAIRYLRTIEAFQSVSEEIAIPVGEDLSYVLDEWPYSLEKSLSYTLKKGLSYE